MIFLNSCGYYSFVAPSWRLFISFLPYLLGIFVCGVLSARSGAQGLAERDKGPRGWLCLLMMGRRAVDKVRTGG